jgi:hypothetical protein
MDSRITRLQNALAEAKAAFSEIVDEFPRIAARAPIAESLLNIDPSSVAEDMQRRYDTACRQRTALAKLTDEDITALGL